MAYERVEVSSREFQTTQTSWLTDPCPRFRRPIGGRALTGTDTDVRRVSMIWRGYDELTGLQRRLQLPPRCFLVDPISGGFVSTS